MEAFIKVFGNLKVTDVLLCIVAVAFLVGVLRSVQKYFKTKAEQDIARDVEYKKILDQVNQYPTWRQQSIDKQKEFTGAINTLSDRIEETNSKIADLQLSSDRKTAPDSRYKIIRFNDEILKHEKHTREHFDQILEAIDDYEEYCRKDKEYKNSKASLAINNIKRVYQECLINNDFL